MSATTRVLLGLSLLSCSLGCTALQVPEHTWPYAPDLLYLEVLQVKMYDTGFEAEVALNNVSRGHQVVLLPEVSCGRADAEGLIQPAYNGRQRILHARAHTRTRHKILCVTSRTKGEIWLRLDRVWSNPSGDHKTPKALIYKDLEWRFTPPQ